MTPDTIALLQKAGAGADVGVIVNIALIVLVIGLHGLCCKRLAATIETERELSLRDIASLFHAVWTDRPLPSRATAQAWALRVALAASAIAVLMNCIHLVTFMGEETVDAKNVAWRLLHVFYAGVVLMVDALTSDCRSRLCIPNIEALEAAGKAESETVDDVP